MKIDLISDTVTRPTNGMLDAMMRAKVGDDVFKSDPTVTELQEKAADLFGMEDALFFPSGTMANQTAINYIHNQEINFFVINGRMFTIMKVEEQHLIQE